MRTRIGTILTLMLAASSTLAAPLLQNTPQADTKTMVQDARCRQVLVTCLINGVPMRMMLDTGATNTVLHKESLAKLKNPVQLNTDNIQLRGNAKVKPEVYMLSLTVDDARIRQHPVFVLDLSGARSAMAEPIDGILGMDILGAMAFTFDVAAGKLHWGLPAGAHRLVPLHGFREESGRMHVQIVCPGGDTTKVLLDSGATLSVIPANKWGAGVGRKQSIGISDVNAMSEQQVSFGVPGDVRLAPGVTVQGVEPMLTDDPEAALLGMDVLGRLRLVHVPSAHNPAGYFFLAL